jgi:hypothetical protein
MNTKTGWRRSKRVGRLIFLMVGLMGSQSSVILSYIWRGGLIPIQNKSKMCSLAKFPVSKTYQKLIWKQINLE